MKRAPWLALALASTAGCSSTAAAPDAGGCIDTSLLNATFEDYPSWTEYAFDGGTIPGSPHTSGPRRVYLKTKPAHGATDFPVGEVIVKEIGPPPASGDSVFAMVKVGCGYNSAGAVDWEWAELGVSTTGTPSIIWTGTVAPPGMSYSGDPTACNTCHAEAKGNDYVQSSELSLSSF